MDKRWLCTTAIVLGLGSYAVNEIGNAVQPPPDAPDELPSTPSRLQLLVNSGSTSLSASASASASATMALAPEQLVRLNLATNMVTGDIYEWMFRDPKERPAEIFDVRSMSAVRQAQPVLILDPGSWRGMANGEHRPGWPSFTILGKTDVRSL